MKTCVRILRNEAISAGDITAAHISSQLTLNVSFIIMFREEIIILTILFKIKWVFSSSLISNCKDFISLKGWLRINTTYSLTIAVLFINRNDVFLSLKTLEE